MRLLAIETSCDDTGIAIIEFQEKTPPKLLVNLVSSQIETHAPWGGVVPMLAKREHQKNLVPLLKQALAQTNLLKNQNAKIKNQKSKIKVLEKILEREDILLENLLRFFKECSKPDIDIIAVTYGPGLEPALWTGVNLAKALSFFWDLPILPINHIEGHIMANFPANLIPQSIFPAICLVVSGGHTQLILIKHLHNYEIIGETRDDAAGEAFDKVAKMLGLGYPGGPIISQITSQLPATNYQLPIVFPRPMINSKDFDFSFSGLKTAVLYFIKKLNPQELKKYMPAIAAEFQQATIDVLVSKTIKAAEKFNTKTVLLSGGVASNEKLQETLKIKTEKINLQFISPAKKLCSDNAAMIALAAYHKVINNQANLKTWQEINAQANLKIE